MSDTNKLNRKNIEIKLSIDNLMCLVPMDINYYISRKIEDISENSITLNENQKLLKNIYIESNYRLSVKIKKQENIDLVKDKEEQVVCQMLVLHLMKAILPGNTIIETGECTKDGEDYLYVLALNNEIISFIMDNKDIIESVYFSKNIEKNCDNNLLDNKFYLSNESNKFNNEVPTALIGCNVYKKYGGILIPSFVN